MYKFLIALFFPALLFSQKSKIEGTITNIQNEKLPLVSVEVYSSQNILLKTVTTNENGNFVLEGINENNVKLNIKDLQYAQLEKNLNLDEQKESLQIILRKDIQEIQEVVMTKQKPLVKRKIDRLEFNVENSNISSLNAWEILKKTPGVTAGNDVLAIKVVRVSL